MDRYSETLNKIFNLCGGVIDLRLERVSRALELFGHPENSFPAIHIAGTNGKGSTAAMLHNILTLAGYRAALYTSPHLVSFTERIRVGADEVTENEVVSLADEISERAGGAGVVLTFFEFITVLALVYFARRQVDIAVVEVGLGGRLDATNVITPLVSVVTTISKDHEAYLGPDELSIAREKGGIIKPGIPVVCGKISEQVSELLGQIAEENQAAVYFLGRDFRFSLKNNGLFDYTGIKQHYSNLTIGLRGLHQRANASLALAALELVHEQYPANESIVRRGLQTVHWPGRLEVMLERPTVILDGAHNPEGSRALVDELNVWRHGRKIRLLFATMADKEWELMLRTLAESVDEMVLTRVDMERSADPCQVAEKMPAGIPHRVIPNSRLALRALLEGAGPDDVIVVAGSLYLLGEVRPMLQELPPVKSTGHSHANSPF